MNDDDVKKVVLAVQAELQQQQPPQERDRTSSGLVEAGANQVLDDRRQQDHQKAGVILHHVVVSSPTPSVLPVYHSAVCCCYPITPEDPIEILHARHVAVAHIIVEVVGLFFCSSAWCRVTPLLAVVSSSLVACCFKDRVVFRFWGVMGGVLFLLHVNAAVSALGLEAADTHQFAVGIFFVYLLLCGVSLLVVHRGCKTASAIRAVADRAS